MPGDNIKGLHMHLKQNQMSTKIFNELDILIGVRMNTVNQGMVDIKAFLDNNNIPLVTPIGRDSDKTIGGSLIATLEALDQFLREYIDTKDTWCVTPPSPVLDDEK
jgi:hypothetical protein